MDRALGKSELSNVVFLVMFFLIILGLGLSFLSHFGQSYYSYIDDVKHNFQMMAKVKGSIYANNETISVFGTCTDAYDVPVINSSGTLTVFYPNGSVYFSNQSMTKLTEGYFLWTGPMPFVEGTFLTEFVCSATINNISYSAKAWGEWQNPGWTNKIYDIYNTTNISIEMINQTLYEINRTQEMVLETQVIANASVDRNNSLLAQLLYYLINLSESHMIPGNLTWTEDPGRVIYGKYWRIKVYVYDDSGYPVYYPEVACTINTTLHSLQYMEDEGNHFSARLYIYQGGDFEWTVNCFYT